MRTYGDMTDWYMKWFKWTFGEYWTKETLWDEYEIQDQWIADSLGLGINKEESE